MTQVFNTLNVVQREKLLMYIAIFLFISISAFDIGRPPIDLHQFRQTQTLSTIYNYFIGGIDLFKPQIDTNGSSSVIILEFPIYQAIVAFIMRIIGYYEEIGRVLNISMTIIGAIYLSKLSDEFFAKGSFIYVFIFYIFSPSIIFWSSTILIDPFVLSLTIISTYFLFAWLEYENNISYIVGVFLASVVLVTKLTLGFIPYFAFLLYIILSGRLKEKVKSILIMGVIWILSIAAWMAYSKYWHSINPHIYTNGSVSWYLGTMSQRLGVEVYKQFYLRIINNHLFFILFVPALLTIFRSINNKRYRNVSISFLISFSLYLFIFVNLNYIHTYYQLPINICFALLSGMGCYFLSPNPKVKIVSTLTILLLLYFSSNKVLSEQWVDMSPISSPYKQSKCEMYIGEQIKDILSYHNVSPRYVGVRLEYSADCWNGEHAIMYFLKEKGYVSLDRNDPRLKSEELDLIIDIYKDRNNSSYTGWNRVYTARLSGSVNQYSVDIFTKSPSSISYTVEAAEREKIYGDPKKTFSEDLVFSNLQFPKFYNINFSFSVTGESNGKGFVILRTYQGGYSEDNYREFDIEDGDSKELYFSMYTSFYDDYTFIIGSKSGVKYEIKTPILVNGKSKFVE
ncbi:MAG: ArnT family glycosyltransferase [Vibrio ordalii]|uniref:ArnT family glycosyltransferase n=1 Tax=Vibrio ordalii TaxID=28174 RepID=UPI003F3B7940